MVKPPVRPLEAALLLALVVLLSIGCVLEGMEARRAHPAPAPAPESPEPVYRRDDQQSLLPFMLVPDAYRCDCDCDSDVDCDTTPPPTPDAWYMRPAWRAWWAQEAAELALYAYLRCCVLYVCWLGVRAAWCLARFGAAVVLGAARWLRAQTAAQQAPHPLPLPTLEDTFNEAIAEFAARRQAARALRPHATGLCYCMEACAAWRGGGACIKTGACT